MTKFKSKTFIALLFASCFCFGGNSLHGQSETVETLSQKYLELYRSGQVSEMAKYLDDQAIMRDPTAETMGTSLELEGKVEIMQTLKGLFAGVSNLSFEKGSGFVSGNFAISQGKFSYDATLPNGQKQRLTYTVLTVLQFKNGLIVEHIDYADYESVLK